MRKSRVEKGRKGETDEEDDDEDGERGENKHDEQNNRRWQTMKSAEEEVATKVFSREREMEKRIPNPSKLVTTNFTKIKDPNTSPIKRVYKNNNTEKNI